MTDVFRWISAGAFVVAGTVFAGAARAMPAGVPDNSMPGFEKIARVCTNGYCFNRYTGTPVPPPYPYYAPPRRYYPLPPLRRRHYYRERYYRSY